MNAATILVLTGSAMFLVGAAIAVPRVFTEPDREQKFRMLETSLVWWRVGQPLYATGALVASGGIGFLAASAASGSGRGWLIVSCLLMLVGALCWSWSVYQRGRRIHEFALGDLPGWPFASYVCLTLAGLGLLGVGLLVANFPAWTGWATLAGALGFLNRVRPFWGHPTVCVLPAASGRQPGLGVNHSRGGATPPFFHVEDERTRATVWNPASMSWAATLRPMPRRWCHQCHRLVRGFCRCLLCELDTPAVPGSPWAATQGRWRCRG